MKRSIVTDTIIAGITTKMMLIGDMIVDQGADLETLIKRSPIDEISPNINDRNFPPISEDVSHKEFAIVSFINLPKKAGVSEILNMVAMIPDEKGRTPTWRAANAREMVFFFQCPEWKHQLDTLSFEALGQRGCETEEFLCSPSCEDSYVLLTSARAYHECILVVRDP